MVANILHPYLTNRQTDKNLGMEEDVSLYMLKFEDIPAIGKQDNDQFHAAQRSKISGQKKDKTSDAI